MMWVVACGGVAPAPPSLVDEDEEGSGEVAATRETLSFQAMCALPICILRLFSVKN